MSSSDMFEDSSAQPAVDHDNVLKTLAASLPRGILREVSYSVQSPRGVFMERGLASTAIAEERLKFLAEAEAVLLPLGSLAQPQLGDFLGRRGCLRHREEQVELFFQRLGRFIEEHGAAELRRLGVTTIGVAELRAADSPEGFSRLYGGIPFHHDSVLKAVIGRAACIDPDTGDEWLTMELAHNARTTKDNPEVAANFAKWCRFPSDAESVVPDSIRRLTLRGMEEVEFTAI